MPSKPAVKKETKATPAETARTARKTAPRVSTAKHRAVKTLEAPISGEANKENNREMIAAIAYGYWESRGCQGGDSMEDWVRAEKEFSTLGAAAPRAAAATA